MFDLSPKPQNKDSSDFITTLAYIAEYKEWDNRAHTERIRKYCHIIASSAGYFSTESETISIASKLHDIGKIGIPESLLNKQGKYTDAEWEIMERHTIEGAAILNSASSPILLTAAKIAETHHERWDGTGYPAKLKGDQIPVGARICAIADVFDALTTKRNYKDVIGTKEALELIRMSSGTLFDPRLVRAFEENFREISKIAAGQEVL
jgi:putative two-component system response regulator